MMKNQEIKQNQRKLGEIEVKFGKSKENQGRSGKRNENQVKLADQ